MLEIIGFHHAKISFFYLRSFLGLGNPGHVHQVGTLLSAH